MLARQIPQAHSTRNKPRYIGLRLTRYTPRVTRLTDWFGALGSAVVPADLNSSTPESETRAPADASITATTGAAEKAKPGFGTTDASTHIKTAVMNTSTTGGIFSSSACTIFPLAPKATGRWVHRWQAWPGHRANRRCPRCEKRVARGCLRPPGHGLQGPTRSCSRPPRKALPWRVIDQGPVLSKNTPFHFTRLAISASSSKWKTTTLPLPVGVTRRALRDASKISARLWIMPMLTSRPPATTCQRMVPKLSWR